ncbi:SDR family oxidoreductase [uncultured Rubinisphaera sp.]|uniref:SDR family oxidoreductase n=1 Tax=uncultured Rubinisphaera sp. TaxID=1678686 RepID=UPI0030DBB929|tara:strand:+ start:257 stop:1144 length:888 start_codon:yes stop_codon:yes gene_type:complete
MSAKQPSPPFPAQGLEKPGRESKMDPAPRFEAPDYRAAGKLKGQVALITGGDSGIGRAVAVLYAREGASVAICYLEEEQGDAEDVRGYIKNEVADESGCGDVLLISGDVTDASFCRSAVEQTVSRFGKLDILVNNAAYQQHQDTIDDITDEEFDRTFKTNIYGYFHMCKAALKHMQSGGCIVNTGSVTGLEGSARLLDYSATKGAIHAFTKSLAQNLVERKIRVNCVAPGPVWTPLNPAERTEEETKKFGSDTPYGRPAQPEEIAPAYVYFASNADSSYITGEVLSALGGSTLAG